MEITIHTESKLLYNSLLRLIKSMGIDILPNKKQEKKIGKDYPLNGSIIKYNKPFDAATNLNDWDVLV